MQVLNLVLVIIFIVFCFAVVIFEIIYFYGAFKVRKSAPYVPVSRRDLGRIIKYLKLGPGARLYDLGSGDGRVLKHALDTHPDITATGFEISPLPRMLSNKKLRQFGARAQIINQSFYEADLRGATHIYLYLFPHVLRKLEPVFDKQLVSGTRVVTVDYVFANKQPIEVIDIAGLGKITKKIHVYVW